MRNSVVTLFYGVERFWLDRRNAVEYFETGIKYSTDNDEIECYRKIRDKLLYTDSSYITDNEILSRFAPVECRCSMCGRYVRVPSWANTCSYCGFKYCLTETVVPNLPC